VYTSLAMVVWAGWHSLGRRRGWLHRWVTGREATAAKEGTSMKSTMVPTSDSWVRPVLVDMGWPACDERLVTVAEAVAHRVGGATSQLPVVRRTEGRHDAGHGP
jgi:hypothetical protein